MNDSPFDDCNSLLDANPYIVSCSVDFCFCGDAAFTTVCTTIAEYSKQCTIAEGTPVNWRTPSLCPINCPLNMDYHECKPANQITCSAMEEILYLTNCHSGCFCPTGMVLDDINVSGCIPTEQCYCRYGGKNYSPGSSFTTSCHNCTCNSGQWQCVDLPCPATCSVEGGSHFTTYDGTQYNFNGDCVYILSKLCNDSSFVVEGYVEPLCDGGSETVLKYVFFRINNEQTFVINTVGGVTMNMMSLQLPFSAGNLHIFKPSTSSIIVHTEIGLQLAIHLLPIMHLYITVSPLITQDLCGLCGNRNYDQSDDFISAGGMVEGTATSAANTWKTTSACSDVNYDFQDPCALNTGGKQYAEYWCSQLIEPHGPFAVCHMDVNPRVYYKNCKYDVCGCKDPEGCLCASLSAYVRACAAKNIFLNGWRPKVCRNITTSCPESMTFSYNIQNCQPSCLSLREPEFLCSIQFVPVDGCVCQKDTYLDNSGNCVPPSECPCYIQGIYLPPGKTMLETGVVCTCSMGQIHCSEGNGIKDCIAPMVYFNCTNAPPGSTGVECLKQCHHLDTPCNSQYCISGCVCPPGMALDREDHCVKEDECPCRRNGLSYQQGETIDVSCSECTCAKGRWDCTRNETIGTCVLYGESHYITFDRKRYTFNGNCEYSLVQDYCNIDYTGTFRVITENVPCGSVETTCSKSIKMFVGECILILQQGTYKEVGCYLDQIPYTVRQSGIFLVVEVNIGITLIWDKKMRITIKLTSEYKGKTCGLCGNFDGNGNNDFKTRSQAEVGDVREFGDSWKASTNCPFPSTILDPCIKNPQRKFWALKKCKIITSEVFADCHSQVDPIPYYEACLRDSCGCNIGEDCHCFCTAVAAYAQACSEACICIHWRTPDICPIFCDYYNEAEGCEWHYRPCGNPCIKTCRNPSGVCPPDFQGLEGCYPTCPPEKPFLEENGMKCVAECGCYDEDGNYYMPGEVMESCTSCEVCECTTKGISCNYNIKACFCEYEGEIYKYKEYMYQMIDSMGNCINVTCGANGTTDRMYYTCPTTARTTILQSSSSASSSTLTSTVSTTAPCVNVRHECEWTDWLDVSKPDDGAGDFETVDFIRKQGLPVCKVPIKCECRAELYPNKTVSELNQAVQCTTSGLVCYNMNQGSSKCLNYQVRFLCCSYERCEEPYAADCLPAQEILVWTKWFNVTNPQYGLGDFETIHNITANRNEVCKAPRDINCRAAEYPSEPIMTNGQNVECNKSIGLVCYNENQPASLCFDYEVQFLCYYYMFEPCFSSTKRPTTSAASRTTSITSSSTSITRSTLSSSISATSSTSYTTSTPSSRSILTSMVSSKTTAASTPFSSTITYKTVSSTSSTTTTQSSTRSTTTVATSKSSTSNIPLSTRTTTSTAYSNSTATTTSTSTQNTPITSFSTSSGSPLSSTRSTTSSTGTGRSTPSLTSITSTPASTSTASTTLTLSSVTQTTPGTSVSTSSGSSLSSTRSTTSYTGTGRSTPSLTSRTSTPASTTIARTTLSRVTQTTPTTSISTSSGSSLSPTRSTTSSTGTGRSTPSLTSIKSTPASTTTASTTSTLSSVTQTTPSTSISTSSGSSLSSTRPTTSSTGTRRSTPTLTSIKSTPASTTTASTTSTLSSVTQTTPSTSISTSSGSSLSSTRSTTSSTGTGRSTPSLTSIKSTPASTTTASMTSTLSSVTQTTPSTSISTSSGSSLSSTRSTTSSTSTGRSTSSLTSIKSTPASTTTASTTSTLSSVTQTTPSTSIYTSSGSSLSSGRSTTSSTGTGRSTPTLTSIKSTPASTTTASTTLSSVTQTTPSASISTSSGSSLSSTRSTTSSTGTGRSTPSLTSIKSTPASTSTASMTSTLSSVTQTTPSTSIYTSSGSSLSSARSTTSSTGTGRSTPTLTSIKSTPASTTTASTTLSSVTQTTPSASISTSSGSSLSSTRSTTSSTGTGRSTPSLTSIKSTPASTSTASMTSTLSSVTQTTPSTSISTSSGSSLSSTRSTTSSTGTGRSTPTLTSIKSTPASTTTASTTLTLSSVTRTTPSTSISTSSGSSLSSTRSTTSSTGTGRSTSSLTSIKSTPASTTTASTTLTLSSVTQTTPSASISTSSGSSLSSTRSTTSSTGTGRSTSSLTSIKSTPASTTKASTTSTLSSVTQTTPSTSISSSSGSSLSSTRSTTSSTGTGRSSPSLTSIKSTPASTTTASMTSTLSSVTQTTPSTSISTSSGSSLSSTRSTTSSTGIGRSTPTLTSIKSTPASTTTASTTSTLSSVTQTTPSTSISTSSGSSLSSTRSTISSTGTGRSTPSLTSIKSTPASTTTASMTSTLSSVTQTTPSTSISTSSGSSLSSTRSTTSSTGSGRSTPTLTSIKSTPASTTTARTTSTLSSVTQTTPSTSISTSSGSSLSSTRSTTSSTGTGRSTPTLTSIKSTPASTTTASMTSTLSSVTQTTPSTSISTSSGSSLSSTRSTTSSTGTGGSTPSLTSIKSTPASTTTASLTSILSSVTQTTPSTSISTSSGSSLSSPRSTTSSTGTGRSTPTLTSIKSTPASTTTASTTSTLSSVTQTTPSTSISTSSGSSLSSTRSTISSTGTGRSTPSLTSIKSTPASTTTASMTSTLSSVTQTTPSTSISTSSGSSLSSTRSTISSTGTGRSTPSLTSIKSTPASTTTASMTSTLSSVTQTTSSTSISTSSGSSLSSTRSTTSSTGTGRSTPSLTSIKSTPASTTTAGMTSTLSSVTQTTSSTSISTSSGSSLSSTRSTTSSTGTGRSTPSLTSIKSTPASTTTANTTSTLSSGTYSKSTAKTPCRCLVDNREYAPGQIVSNSTDVSGCIVDNICRSSCQVVPGSKVCPSTTSLPSPPKTTMSDSTSKFYPCLNISCFRNGSLNVHLKECPLVEIVKCAVPPIKVYDEQGCCFHYECPGCTGTDGEKKIIGDSWEVGCQICNCSNLTNGLPAVFCNNKICNTPSPNTCGPDREAVQLTDPDDPCCPKTECRCKPQKCYKMVKVCPLGFEFSCINPVGDGCCPTFECTRRPVCIVDGTEYQPGAFVYTAFTPCTECYCSDNVDPSTQFNIVKCEPIKCLTDCPQGYEYKMEPAKCCGRCVQVACILKTEYNTSQVIKPGDNWFPYGLSCAVYYCSVVKGQFLLAMIRRPCVEVRPRTCLPEEVPYNCCNSCDAADCILKSKPLSIANCTLENDVILSYCELNGSSATQYPPSFYNAALPCDCCKMLVSSTKTVNILFNDGTSLPHTYLNAEKCGCASCK
ncbi:mucin-2-like [Pleurodeles waltl]|uniref:mucin-2-like n=1 Tax=Pleurodeles waltl TaxID=8319 RepID=UPI0037099C16